MKTQKASGALRQAPDPMPTYAHFAHTTLLYHIGKIGQTRAGPLWPNPGSATEKVKTVLCSHVCYHSTEAVLHYVDELGQVDIMLG